MIAGIDTHKDTLAVAVVDDTGQLVAGGDIPNTERGFVQLVNMFDSHHVLRRLLRVSNLRSELLPRCYHFILTQGDPP